MLGRLSSQFGEMEAGLAELAERWRGGDIGDAAYASLYFLNWQVSSHGRRFASRRFKQDPRPNPVAWMTELNRIAGRDLQLRLIHYLERYSFLGIIPNVCASLQAWLQGRWPMILCEHIPSPHEVLRMQVQGSRAVTVLSEYPRLLQPVLNKANAFVFMVHDLEHAYKFFHDRDLYEGQRRFFAEVLTSIERGLFDSHMSDSEFAEKFNYLISDMNTHMVHSLQFLRAILIEHYLRKEGKPAREKLSRASHAELDAIIHSFDGCWRYAGAIQGKTALLTASRVI